MTISAEFCSQSANAKRKYNQRKQQTEHSNWPLPDRPTRATILPAGISRLKSLRTMWSGRVGYVNFTDLNSTEPARLWNGIFWLPVTCIVGFSSMYWTAHHSSQLTTIILSISLHLHTHIQLFDGPLAGNTTSVLWHCWLGSRKAIRPVKNWVVGCRHGYLTTARCWLAYGPPDATATHCLLPQHVHCHWLITHSSHFLLNFQLPTGFVLVG